MLRQPSVERSQIVLSCQVKHLPRLNSTTFAYRY
jgi:hypothetical protein